MNDVRGQRVSVIGAARSGIGVAGLLRQQGAAVFVSDQQPAEKLKIQLAELDADGVAYETGGHTERVYACSLMVISPGVPSDAPVVIEATRRQIRIVSELEVSSWYSPARMIAVTGSNGKTTTTTLIGRMMADVRRPHVVAGNIGTAFASVVASLTPEDLAVLEVSSFQLDHIEQFKPWISVLLNITEDHMDRYGYSMERYAASKARVFANQGTDDVLVYNADDPWTARVVSGARCRKLPFSTHQRLNEGAFVEGKELVTILNRNRAVIVPVEEVSLKGMHNLSNTMAAVLVGQLAGIGRASLRATLRNFKGVEHRLEFVRDVDGVRYVNDSKATNVDSVWYALQSFREPIVLLLGGRDKGNDYSRLIEPVREHVKAIIAVGESSGKVRDAFASTVPVTIATTMEDAVRQASNAATRGDVVLLSPACASFDWFENYEHRGRVFKELVHQL